MSYVTDPTYNPLGNAGRIVDGANILSIKHAGNMETTYYEIVYEAMQQTKKINADKIFIAAGVETPAFIQKALNPNDQLS